MPVTNREKVEDKTNFHKLIEEARKEGRLNGIIDVQKYLYDIANRMEKIKDPLARGVNEKVQLIRMLAKTLDEGIPE